MSDVISVKELNFLSLLKLNIKTPPLVLDIGSNRGDYTAHCRNGGLGANGTLGIYHLFEPIPYNVANLKERFPVKNVHINPIAIDIEEGPATFHVVGDKTEEDGMSSLHYRPDVFPKFKHDAIQVQKMRLDNWFHQVYQNGKPQIIDLIKIDTEGNELRVIQSFEKLWDTVEVRAIQFEYGMCWKDSGASIVEMIKYLNSKGYDIFEHMSLQGSAPLLLTADDYTTRTWDNFFAISRKLWTRK